MRPHTCANCGLVVPVSIRVDDFFKVKKVFSRIYTCSIECLIAYNLAHGDEE